MSFPLTEIATQLQYAGQVVLDRYGNGAITFDPGSARERWEVTAVVVSTNQPATATVVPVATVGKNTVQASQLSQGNNRGQSWSGNQDTFAGTVHISPADFLSVLFSAPPGTTMPQTVFAQEATGTSLAADPTAYTMGMEFSVTQAAALTGAWFYSASGAGVLPQVIALYAVAGTVLVHQETATWSGAPGSGWVRAAFAAPPALTAATSYRVCVLQDTAANWYSGTVGGLTAGKTAGIISVPSSAASDVGQDSYNAGVSLAYPATSGSGENFWIDPEVSQLAGVIAYAVISGSRYTRRA